MATAVQLIDTQQDAAYFTQRVRLDDRDFQLSFAWNQREERWYMSILDTEETPLAMGIKLVANWPLTRYKGWDPRMPPGEFMVMDRTQNGEPPGWNELGIGRRCELNYFATLEQ